VPALAEPALGRSVEAPPADEPLASTIGTPPALSLLPPESGSPGVSPPFVGVAHATAEPKIRSALTLRHFVMTHRTVVAAKNERGECVTDSTSAARREHVRSSNIAQAASWFVMKVALRTSKASRPLLEREEISNRV
jgi:hypothetical protein